MPLLSDGAVITVEVPVEPVPSVEVDAFNRSVELPTFVLPVVELPADLHQSVEAPSFVPPAVDQPVPSDASVTVIRGPQGPPGADGADGAAGDLGTEIVVSEAAATWTIPVPPGFDRTPNVQVYVGGQYVLADVQADHNYVVVTNPEPMTGLVVLN